MLTALQRVRTHAGLERAAEKRRQLAIGEQIDLASRVFVSVLVQGAKAPPHVQWL